jgi:hypothetical protein
MVGNAVSQLGISDSKINVSVGDQVKLQFNAKRLAGSSLLELPVMSK